MSDVIKRVLRCGQPAAYLCADSLKTLLFDLKNQLIFYIFSALTTGAFGDIVYSALTMDA